MIEGIENKKYPSVTIQGVLLGTNLLLFEQSTQNIFYIISIIILLALFFLQAVNHRFYYFFPVNKFMGKVTYHIDTIILYVMVLLAFLFTIFGLTNSYKYTAFATGFIVLPPFAWLLYVYPILRKKIADKLSKEDSVFQVACPQCKNQAELIRKVKQWNEGEESLKCPNCNYEETKIIVKKIVG